MKSHMPSANNSNHSRVSVSTIKLTEWDKVELYFANHPHENRYQWQQRNDQKILPGYIRTPDQKIYKLWNKSIPEEKARYEEKYNELISGSNGQVEYAEDRSGNIYVIKISAKNIKQENKRCLLAGIQSSPSVGVYTGAPLSLMVGQGVEFFMPMRYLGKNLIQYFKDHQISLQKAYDVAIKIMLAVNNFIRGEALSGQPSVLLDFKPENVLIDHYDNVHIIDLDLVSTDLSVPNKCREGSEVYMLPSTIVANNLQKNMLSLLRTLFLDPSFECYDKLKSMAVYSRKESDFYVFKQANIANAIVESEQQKIEWLLSTAGNIEDVVKVLEIEMLDLAFLFAQAKTKALEELQQDKQRELDKSSLFKQALISATLAGVVIDQPLALSLESNLELQVALVALGKFENTAEKIYLSKESTSALFKSDKCLQWLNEALLCFPGAFKQSLNLLQQAILALVEANICDVTIWQEVLENNVALQRALVLLRCPGRHVVFYENHARQLAESVFPIMTAVDILAKMETAFQEHYREEIRVLVAKNISGTHAVWEQIANNNAAIIHSVIALKEKNPACFLERINLLISSLKFQELINDIVSHDAELLSDYIIENLIEQGNKINAAIQLLENFDIGVAIKKNIFHICKAKNIEKALFSVVLNCVFLMYKYSETNEFLDWFRSQQCNIEKSVTIDAGIERLASKGLSYELNQGRLTGFKKVYAKELHQKFFPPMSAESYQDTSAEDKKLIAIKALLQAWRVLSHCSFKPRAINTAFFYINPFFSLGLLLSGVTNDDFKKMMITKNPCSLFGSIQVKTYKNIRVEAIRDKHYNPAVRVEEALISPAK